MRVNGLVCLTVCFVLLSGVAGLFVLAGDHDSQSILDFKPHELLPPETKREDIGIRVRLEPAKDPNILRVSAPNKEYKIEVSLKMDEKGNFAGIEPLHWSKGAVHEMAQNISFAGYTFEPEKDSVLTFRVEPDKGYVYVSGKGKVTITLDDNQKGFVIGHPAKAKPQQKKTLEGTKNEH